ncbi:hypothetical protein [Mesorhizobium sp. 2RAF21]|uniref:hypothetical protein n=1 Tax=Mesorhizobium sp. 2RAF21 TaxID=3232995 RepID=UPI003F9CBE70
MSRKTDAADDASKAKDQASTNSTHTPGESDQGGAGNTAGSAGAPTADELIKAGAEASRHQMAEVNDFLKAEQEKVAGPQNLGEAMREWDERGYGPKGEFRTFFPKLTAAIEAWQASGVAEPPTGLRIVATVDGFRRCGLTHSKSGTNHPLEAFPSPVQLEQLFSEPNLVVSFV